MTQSRGSVCQQQVQLPFKQHQGPLEDLLYGGVFGMIIRDNSHRTLAMHQAGQVLSDLPGTNSLNPHNAPMRQV